MLRPAVTLFVTLLAVAVFVPVLLAQPTTLQGTVVDASGAPVPSAKITLEEGNRVRDSTTTDEKGFYSFEGIKPGAYRVRASAPQMTLEKAVQLDLKPGVTKLDLKLDIAHVE